MNINIRLPAVQTFFVLLYILALVLPFKAEAEYAQPLMKAPLDIQQAYQQASADFNLYRQFLLAEETPRGQVLLNVHNPYEASVFLSRGFGDDLADAICSSFTRYDRERERLMLIPCDGLPTIGPAQRNDVMYYIENQKLIIFQYRFDNCYQSGDAYLYSVRTRLRDGWWKIEALELLELNHNSA